MKYKWYGTLLAHYGREKMNILMRALQLTENKAGEIKFLNEAFIRLNFNNFYIEKKENWHSWNNFNYNYEKT